MLKRYDAARDAFQRLRAKYPKQAEAAYAVGVLQNLFPAFTAIYSLYLDIQNRGWRRDKLESPVHPATSRESLPSGHAPALSSLRGGITR